MKTLKLVISRSSFDEYGRELFKNACRTCSTIFLIILTNNITAFWRCRCRSRRRFLNSLFGSFSNDDGNGNALLRSLRDYCKLFNMTKRNETVTSGASFRGENENLFLSADVLHKTSNLAISPCCFAEDGKEMDKMEKRTCRACKTIVFPY